jgi:GH24 family phage-related lysozyme (muramidase)
MVINTLLDSRIATFKRELKVKFTDFDTYPMTVQFALTDMAFNLGTNGVVTKFPNFTKAIKARDWKKAAKESNRPQVNQRRNSVVRKWLESPAKLGDWNAQGVIHGWRDVLR